MERRCFSSCSTYGGIAVCVVALCLLSFFLLFELHYFQRAFIFPFLMKGKSRMPIAIMLMGVVFNVLNGFMQGEWLFYLAPEGLLFGCMA